MTDIVDLALACYRRPLEYQDRFSLAAPRPAGLGRLLWLANGSPEALEAEVHRTGARPQELRNAARFYVQQWCLARGADPCRVLGVEPDAAQEQIKEHYRLLMRLFHPDRGAGRETWTDHYASRINEAWAVLSRTPDRAPPDSQSYPPPVPIRDTVRPAADRAVERSGSLSVRNRPERRFRARRQLPRLVWGGLALAVPAVLGGFYLDRFSVGQGGFDPAGAVSSASPPSVTTVPEPVPAVVEAGALAPLLAAPDWRTLEQREQEAQRQAAQLRERRAQWEQTRQQQLVAEEALLESMREERAQLEKQIRIEQARMKQARAERLAAEQQQLAWLQTEQARVEQARTERELAERQRLDALQAEQAKTERLAEELRAERQRLEKLKAEQARAEQAKSELAKMERAQAERRRPEEQPKAERAERARTGQARPEAATNRAPAVLMTATMASGEDNLTASELEGLMSRYTQAYQRGDLSGVVALFASGARGRIQGDYAALFATHYIRGLWLRDLRWAYRGPSASGAGRYELKLRRRDNGELRQVEGNIRFTVQKQDSQIVIEAIDYDWPEK